MAIATYLNFKSVLLTASAWGPTSYKTTATALVAVGTAANETFYDVATGGASLQGGKGDDTYYVTSKSTQVIEAAAGGTDTVVAYVHYALPAAVENLTLGGSNITGTGNALDNIIVSTGARNVLNGGAGQDVLINQGEAGQRFMFKVGDGQDIVVGFKTGAAHDFVRVAGLESFDAVKAKMTQVGSDVLLKVSDTDAILFKGKVIADFSAKDFLFTVDTTKMTLTFNEGFDTLSLYDSTTGKGVWKTNFISGSQDSIWTGYSSRTLAPNHELQIYVDPKLAGSGSTALGLNPFSTKDGVLTITAAKATAAQEAALWGFDYTSGLLTTEKSFAQKYGYFEIRADLPTGQGVWPAFWLLPVDQTKTAELDVMENVNGSDTVVQTMHSAAGGTVVHDGFSSVVPGLTDGFHTYGMMWTAETITWYIDGVAVSSVATPADMNTEMYMLVNLAIGGDWPGSPAANFTSADYKIDYVRAYSLSGATVPVGVPSTGTTLPSSGTEVAAPGTTSPVTPPPVVVSTTVESLVSTTLSAKFKDLVLTGHGAVNGTGNELSNIITGNDANNRLLGAGGNDTLHGGAGNDLLDGGTGIDDMRGGKGDDSYVVDHSLDVIVELAGEGYDSVQSSVTYTLSANVEALTLTGTANIDARGGDGGVSLTGNSGANTLYGGAGADILDGGKGVDRMIGGAGDDTYYVDNGSDVVVELANGGHDTVMSGVTYRLADNVEDLTLLWTGGSWAYGNSSDNILTGNSGDNRLYGYAGKDTLLGGAGADVLDGGAGNDLLTGGSGSDTFVFGRGSGHDVVTDFGAGDFLDLSAYMTAGIKPQLTANDAGVTITLSSTDSILLEHAHLSDLVVSSTGYFFH